MRNVSILRKYIHIYIYLFKYLSRIVLQSLRTSYERLKDILRLFYMHAV